MGVLGLHMNQRWRLLWTQKEWETDPQGEQTLGSTTDMICREIKDCGQQVSLISQFCSFGFGFNLDWEKLK